MDQVASVLLDLPLFGSKTITIAMVVFAIAGAAFARLQLVPSFLQVASGVVLVPAVGWFWGFLVFPDLGTKDGTGGLAAIERENRLVFAWVAILVLSYFLGLLLGLLQLRGVRET